MKKMKRIIGIFVLTLITFGTVITLFSEQTTHPCNKKLNALDIIKDRDCTGTGGNCCY